jgi:hypothetical protein
VVIASGHPDDIGASHDLRQPGVLAGDETSSVARVGERERASDPAKDLAGLPDTWPQTKLSLTFIPVSVLNPQWQPWRSAAGTNSVEPK